MTRSVGHGSWRSPGATPPPFSSGWPPLIEAGLIDLRTIIVDAKSGVSGAGRKLSLRTHFVETNENFAPYNVGRVHRHVGEMDQELSRLADGAEVTVIFTPHLVPMNQGILSSMYVDLKNETTTEELMDLYRTRYAGRTVRPRGEPPAPRRRSCAIRTTPTSASA